MPWAGSRTPRNLEHKRLRAVHANDELQLTAPDDPGLARSLPHGTRIYSIETLAIDSSRKPRTLRTVCTSAMFFARPGADPALVSKLVNLLSLSLDRIVPSR